MPAMEDRKEALPNIVERPTGAAHAFSVERDGRAEAKGLVDAKKEELGEDVVFQATSVDDAQIELLTPVNEGKHVSLEFRDICGYAAAAAPNSGGSFWQRSTESQAVKKQLLHHLAGSCLPGELLALMGPSGSGKTSLLSVLGGRAGIEVSGMLLYNGQPLVKRVKRQIGFVLQDDILYESLTVYETLFYAAMLRLPREMSDADKLARVDNVITALGLGKCRNTIIGGFFRRGVSGGERKRVAVGVELLINPSVLLLDEPTSGLDSTTAMQLVAALRRLASGGRAVVTTIHQPSSRLYGQLDSLMLLADGHALYYGGAQCVADWFEQLGFPMPLRMNPADFILDVASGQLGTKKLAGEESKAYLWQCCETYLEDHPRGYAAGTDLSQEEFGAELWTKAVSRKDLMKPAKGFNGSNDGSGGSAAAAQRISTVQSMQSLAAASQKGADVEKGTGMAKAESRWGAPWVKQVQYLFQRAIKVRRYDSYSSVDVFRFLGLGVVMGLFWFKSGEKNTLAGMNDTKGLLLIEAMFLTYSTWFAAMFTFPSEFKMMLKERASGMYRLSAFYVARTLSDLPMELVLPGMFVVVLYWLGGLRATPGAFFANLFGVLLELLVAQSIGYLVGATVMSPKVATAISMVLVIGIMLTAGFFVAFIPPWISWVRWASIMYYAYNLLIKIQYRGAVIYDCGTENVKHPERYPEQCTVVTNLRDAANLAVSPDAWPYEALVLLAWLIGVRFLVYVALRVKTRSKASI